MEVYNLSYYTSAVYALYFCQYSGKYNWKF